MLSFSSKSMFKQIINIIIPIIVKITPMIKVMKKGEKYLCFVYFSAMKKNIE
jgi:hypothetical protein